MNALEVFADEMGRTLQSVDTDLDRLEHWASTTIGKRMLTEEHERLVRFAVKANLILLAVRPELKQAAE